MAMEKLVCISCKGRITNKESSTQFPCPNCGEYKVIRCGHCRDIAARYTCPQCKFSGPN
ncbi:DUF1610 domain-containing protein [Candidatus Woesearchaeota archaeon]|nr:DUF1610 domain-containing protein [Candidatus Woesearchaeota archaeon]